MQKQQPQHLWKVCTAEGTLHKIHFDQHAMNGVKSVKYEVESIV